MKYLFTILALLISSTFSAQDFHVEITGNDSSSGTETQPWASIQHAMNTATPGSTVFFHAGVYNERVSVNVDGTAGNYITFKAYNTDEVVLDGTGFTDYALLDLFDVQYVAIEGINIKNNIQADAVGVLIQGVTDHIRIKDCAISNIHFSADPNATITSSTNAQALIVYGNDPTHAITELEIIGNEVFDCRLGFSEALAVNGNVDGFVVTENIVHDVTNIGIDILGHEGTCSDPLLDQARNGVIADNETYNCLSPYATSAGIYVDGGKDLIIERNLVHHNQWGIEIGAESIGDSTDNIIVRNNFIYRNSTAGITLGGFDYPTGSGKVTNVKVINNSLFGNDTEDSWSGEIYLSYIDGLEVRNNIFYADNANGALMSDQNLPAASTGISMSSNAWYHPSGDGNVGWVYQGEWYSTILEFHNETTFAPQQIFVDPAFQSIGTTPDLHLTSVSPATVVDAGELSLYYGTTDIDGENRVAGSNVDTGADEFGSGLCVGDFDGDGTVGVNDFLVLNSEFGSTCTPCAADTDGNGIVDVSDFLALNSAFGNVCW